MTNLLTTITEKAIQRLGIEYVLYFSSRDYSGVKELLKSELSLALKTVKREVEKMKDEGQNVYLNEAYSKVIELLNPQQKENK